MPGYQETTDPSGDLRQSGAIKCQPVLHAKETEARRCNLTLPS